jgi:hypothetical protein
MFSSEKASENQLLESLEPLLFSLLFWLQLISLGNTSNLQESKFHFSIGSNQFQGRLWFLLDQLSILVTVCNRNWFVNSYVLYQLHVMTRICISILLI